MLIRSYLFLKKLGRAPNLYIFPLGLSPFKLVKIIYLFSISNFPQMAPFTVIFSQKNNVLFFLTKGYSLKQYSSGFSYKIFYWYISFTPFSEKSISFPFILAIGVGEIVKIFPLENRFTYSLYYLDKLCNLIY